MKTEYKGKLRCITCGSDSSFEFNDDKTYIKCTLCNKEYLGGYDELVSLNSETIEEVKQQITQDVKKEIEDRVKNALKGFKNIEIR